MKTKRVVIDGVEQELIQEWKPDRGLGGGIVMHVRPLPAPEPKMDHSTDADAYTQFDPKVHVKAEQRERWPLVKSLRVWAVNLQTQDNYFASYELLTSTWHRLASELRELLELAKEVKQLKSVSRQTEPCEQPRSLENEVRRVFRTTYNDFNLELDSQVTALCRVLDIRLKEP